MHREQSRFILKNGILCAILIPIPGNFASLLDFTDCKDKLKKAYSKVIGLTKLFQTLPYI